RLRADVRSTRLRPLSVLAAEPPGERTRRHRAGQRAPGRAGRAPRRPGPQRDAALATRAARDRLRRRADRARRRATRLGHTVAPGTRLARAPRLARAAVRARDRLARRAGARPRRVRARARAAALAGLDRLDEAVHVAAGAEAVDVDPVEAVEQREDTRPVVARIAPNPPQEG